MTEQLRESLSALMDDEANELELERILSRIGQDDELRGTWVRYHAVRAASSAQAMAPPQWDISGRVMAAIAEQQSAPVQRWQRMLRPLGGFAVAASVAAVVVVGGQQWYQAAEPELAASQSSSAPALGFVNAIGGTPVQASLGGSRPEVELTPAARSAYQELARQRLLMYSQQHAEQAALNTPQGLIPYARVPHIQE